MSTEEQHLEHLDVKTAAIPSAAGPVAARRRRIVKKKHLSAKQKAMKYGWIAGHTTIFVASLIEIACYAVFQSKSLFARVVYRVIFAAAIVTYGIALKKKTGLHGRDHRAPLFMILHLPTTQYGLLACLWFVSKHHLLKLTPYVVYSMLQLLDYSRRHVISSEDTKVKIDNFLTNYGSKLERAVADSNILLFVRLVLDVITIQRGSGVSLMAYIFYFRLNMDHPQMKEALGRLEEQVDKLISNPKTPAKVKDIWKKMSWSIHNRNRYALTPADKAAQEAAIAEAKAKEAEDAKRLQKYIDENRKTPELAPAPTKSSGFSDLHVSDTVHAGIGAAGDLAGGAVKGATGVVGGVAGGVAKGAGGVLHGGAKGLKKIGGLGRRMTHHSKSKEENVLDEEDEN